MSVGKLEKSRPEEIVARLKRKIYLGEYCRGDALPREEELARLYQVSRGCIRECLSVLKAQGYLESRRGKHGGTFVTNVLESDEIDNLYGELVLLGQMRIGDLLDARLLIEPEAAAAATLRAKEEDLARLEESILFSMSKEENQEEEVASNAVFHKMIGELSGNPFFSVSIRSFMKFTEMFMQVVGKGEGRIAIHELDDHKAILAAIRSRDHKLAYERMYVHDSKVKANMIVLEQLFRQRVAD